MPSPRCHSKSSDAFLRMMVTGLFVAGSAVVFPVLSSADGANPFISFPLHAEQGLIYTCDPARSVTCWCGPPYLVPTIVAPPNTEVTVFLLASNLCLDVALHGVQTAFEWDSSWKLLGSSWDCQSNQLSATTPHEPGGPREGAIVTVFDCAIGNDSQVVGRMHFRTGDSGCVRQVQPGYPYGAIVLDCDGGYDLIPFDVEERLGSVCVDWNVGDGCWDPGAVLDSTWGQIKAKYSE